MIIRSTSDCQMKRAVNEWWMAVESEGMGGRNFRVELPTYSSLQAVMYRLGMERSSEQTRDVQAGNGEEQ